MYYSVRCFEEYGKLSGQPLENLESGARVDPGEQKSEPLDFALWKRRNPGNPPGTRLGGRGGRAGTSNVRDVHQMFGEPSISTAAGRTLSPAHENEVAQSEGAFGKPFVRYGCTTATSI